jgi:hypothetical protein
MPDECVCLDPPVFPWVTTVALLVECQPDNKAFSIFPFTGQDMTVVARRPQWRKGIPGRISMNRLLGTSCQEHQAGEKERGI